MHNKIHSVISPLFRIKNADTETGWNVQILRSVWIISAEIRYLLSEQKKFQNKSKNIDEVYQSVFFRCIMFLSYRVTFLCNVLGQIHYTSESPVRYFFMKKLSISTSCGKLFLMIRTPFSLSCFSPPPAIPPIVGSSEPEM